MLVFQPARQGLHSGWLFALGASALLLSAGCAGPDPQPAAPEQPAERAGTEPAQDGAQPADAKPADGGAKADGAKPQGPPGDQPTGGPPPDGGLNDLANELNLRDQERAALGRHYFETGKRFYDTFEYRKAAESFAKAYEANPNDAEILHYMLMAQLLAGERQAEFKSVAELLAEQRQASVEQEKADLKRLYKEGETLFNAQEFERSIVRFEQVLEKIRWFPYQIDSEGFEDSARGYIVRARRLQRERQLAQAEEQERRALEQANQEQERYRRELSSQLETLLRRTLDQIVLHNYDAAEETIGEILRKDPQNAEALKLRELAIEGRHTGARKTNYVRNVEEHTLDDEIALNDAVPYLPGRGRGVDFPDREFWETVVRARTGSISEAKASEPEWVKEHRKILESRTVTLNFPDTPFAEVIAFLQDITGLNITVAGSVDAEETTVSLRLRDILLKDALKIILEQTGLAMTFQDETLLLTQPEEARGEYVLEIYDVQDLLSKLPDFPGDKIRVAGDSGGGGGGAGGSFTFDDSEEGEGTVLDPDQLETIITNSVGEDKWDDPASIEIHRGQIIVNQTREVHTDVRRVLRNLRRNSGLFVQVETRFIRMTDDFLRDIGVDFRSLGRSDSIGQPGVFGQGLDLDTNVPRKIRPADDIGFGRQIATKNQTGGNPPNSQLGPISPGGVPFFGSSMFGGRTENFLNGGHAYFQGERLNGTSVISDLVNKGLAGQITVLDPFQINAIIRAEEEEGRRKIVDAPVITAANRQRVSVSIITQRAYISDYELSSGGTGQIVAEVADPIIETFQEGVVLDVRPTISADRKYITLDVKPTLATLVDGLFRQIPVNLGTISNAAINVNIEVPEVTLQEAYTSITLPDGGTAMLGGFRKINEKSEHAGVPFVDRIPLLNKLFSREAELYETASTLILVTARTISLRDEEKKLFNLDED